MYACADYKYMLTWTTGSHIYGFHSRKQVF